MSQDDSIWVGADPGGRNNFGVAVLWADGSVHTARVSCADEAVDEVRQQVEDPPAGVGVDAPLWWSSGISGGRCVDQWLRSRYGLAGGQVQPPNALRGAALVQGFMFVQRIRELFPDVPVTETHPKALLAALKIDERDFYNRFLVQLEAGVVSEHERDAVISAVAAREGFNRQWTTDLSVSRYPSEQDPSRFWLAPVHYFWPHKQ